MRLPIMGGAFSSIAAAISFLEGLYPPPSSFGSPLTSPPQQERHTKQASDPLPNQSPPATVSLYSVDSVCSSPVAGTGHGDRGTPDSVSMGSVSSGRPRRVCMWTVRAIVGYMTHTHKHTHIQVQMRESETRSLDRVQLRHRKTIRCATEKS